MLARGRLAALAEAPGCLLEKANALGWLSILVIGEDPRESLSASVESADLARRAGSRQLEIWRMNGIAEESFFLGDWSDTLAVISELEQKELTSIQRTELNCTEAMLAALTGSPTRAISLLEERAGLPELERIRCRTRDLLHGSFRPKPCHRGYRIRPTRIGQRRLREPMGINSPLSGYPGSCLPLAAGGRKATRDAADDEGFSRQMDGSRAFDGGSRIGCTRGTGRRGEPRLSEGRRGMASTRLHARPCAVRARYGSRS